MAKGSQYERDIARTLSLWWSKGKRDDLFWRTSGSGARATVRAKQDKQTKGHYGDIACTSSYGRSLLRFCVIEVKRGYNRITINDLLDQKNTHIPSLREWIRKVEHDRELAGSYGWLLIVKRDRRDPIMFMSSDVYHAFSILNDNTEAICFTFCDVKMFFCIRLESFFELIRPEEIRKFIIKVKGRK